MKNELWQWDLQSISSFDDVWFNKLEFYKIMIKFLRNFVCLQLFRNTVSFKTTSVFKCLSSCSNIISRQITVGMQINSVINERNTFSTWRNMSKISRIRVIFAKIFCFAFFLITLNVVIDLVLSLKCFETHVCIDMQLQDMWNNEENQSHQKPTNVNS